MAMYNLTHTQQGLKNIHSACTRAGGPDTQWQFDTKPYTKEVIIFGKSDEKLRPEALAKDVDLDTQTKTALGYE